MEPKLFLDGKVKLYAGDCREVLLHLEENSIDSCVTDPPYHLTSIMKRFGSETAAPAKSGKTGAYARASRGFMGKQWDGGDVAFDPATWELVLRVLKPGGHLLAFSGTRTYHRMACAIEDAGFEIRDQVGWAFGSGFPKSHDIAKQIDKSEGHWRGRAGAITIAEQVAKGTEYERTEKGDPITAAAAWNGWGTALKPAWEPICLARKPLSESSIAANVLKHGTGAINIDGCRVNPGEHVPGGGRSYGACDGVNEGWKRPSHAGYEGKPSHSLGRWPANLIHDGSEEVLERFPESDGAVSNGRKGKQGLYEDGIGSAPQAPSFADSGSAARFFYTAKADANDRLGSRHPTVKPVDLIKYLIRLVTPRGGVVLDPFAGTGTGGEAAFYDGFRSILIEREPEYLADIEKRMSLVLSGPDERRAASVQQLPPDDLPMFSRGAA